MAPGLPRKYTSIQRQNCHKSVKRLYEIGKIFINRNLRKNNSPFRGIVFPFLDIAPTEFCGWKKYTYPLAKRQYKC